MKSPIKALLRTYKAIVRGLGRQALRGGALPPNSPPAGAAGGAAAGGSVVQPQSQRVAKATAVDK